MTMQRSASTTALTFTFTLALALPACSGGAGESDTDTDTASTSESESESDTTTDTAGDTAGVELDGACEGPLAEGGRLAVVGTDFVTGSVSSVDVATSEVTLDVAAATTDTVAVAHGDALYLIHRYGTNRVDVVGGGSYSVVVDGVAEPNPQALAVGADGLGYLTLFGAPEVQIIDLGAAPSKVGAIPLTDFADADGNPEAGVAIACGTRLVVGVQRLVDFAPVDHSILVVLDTGARAVIDVDPATEGVQGIELLGAFPRQIRVDPADPSGATLLVLTDGIERVHLPTATSTWATDRAALEAAGLTGYAPQAFVVDAAGTVAYLTAADGDYPGAAVWRIGLDGGAPTTPEKLIVGVASSEKLLERIGDTLWVGDASPDQSGLRTWDLGVDPPVETTTSPLSTGLPPYTMVVRP
ncbi:MAG: hypothetical protein R3B09_31890 [Nannocystaceae bacterium]